MAETSGSTATFCILTAGSALLALQIPFMRVRTLPFMATPVHKVRKALQSLPTRGTLVDLGSGDGSVVREAARLGYKSIGIEINSTLYLYSQVNRLFWQGSAQFVRSDLFQYPLHDANVVFLFGVRPYMPRLSQKIAQECRPGTFVLSYRFGLPTGGKDQAKAELIYDEEEMRIYEVLGDADSSR